jgi:hypothetical protein
MKQDLGPVIIYVSRAGGSTNLKLRDNRNNPMPPSQPGNQSNISTEVDPGNTIIWQLDTDSDIESLVSIRQTFEADGAQYKNSVAVLVADPVKQPDGTITAQVKNPSPGKGKFANYKIVYTLTGGGQYEDDPKIYLNS